jgi:hypothetical protein
MLTVAGVVAVDTGPELLRISDQVPRLDAVAVQRVPAGVRCVELRILAASHQVVVTVEQGERVEHVETVACELPGDSGVPVHHGGTYDHGPWQVTASVGQLGAQAFHQVATRWRRRGRSDAGSIVVQFPNHADALTGLAWLGEGWVGVHLYPASGPEGGGVVVRTATVRTLSYADRPSDASSRSGVGGLR